MKENSTSAQNTDLFVRTSMESIAHRIRSLRKERGWSLAEIERLSRGKIKAIVLGSYERGDRTLSIKRAIELADFFGVPLTHLLAPEIPSPQRSAALIIDIRRLKALSGMDDQRLRLLTSYIARLVNLRRDWNGELLSLRESDLPILGLLLGNTEIEVIRWLEKNRLLFIAPSHP